ncbi:hypothetical protein SAMN05444404_1608 [Ruegeria lacuscaerulensis ITI-1157]|nr:hypothetical protein SAMN05444404_1608 [Ruegeria lacuscaerulensis ITI-1157]
MWQGRPGQNKEEHVKRRCHRCRGMGRAPCQICNGKGEVPKGRDHLGRLQFTRCNGCFGVKTSRCSVCGGEGFA